MATNITSSTLAPTTSTPRLLSLPSELRNLIYEVVLSPSDPDAKVNLIHANPPAKSLLLVSKQIYTDTYAMYKRIYRKYWRSTNFTLNMSLSNDSNSSVPKAKSMRKGLRELPNLDLSNIRNCDITWPEHRHFTVICYHGFWSMTDDHIPHTYWRAPPLISVKPYQRPEGPTKITWVRMSRLESTPDRAQLLTFRDVLRRYTGV